MSVQMAVNMANFEALVRKPHIKMVEYKKWQMTKVSNCFKSDFKGIFILVLPELRKSFRLLRKCLFRNRVRSTVRIWENFHLVRVLHSCPIPMGGTNCHVPLQLRREFASKFQMLPLN